MAMMQMIREFWSLSLMLAPMVVLAGLEFENKRLDVTARVGDTQVEAVFKFVNKGDAAVEIAKIQTSCTCATASVEKKIYEPNEAGEIKVKFVFGERSGEQLEQVVVAVKDEGIQRLSFRVVIPTYLQIEPASLSWDADGKEARGKMEIKIPDDIPPAQAVQIKSKNPRLNTTLREKEKGCLYELQIEPKEPAEKRREEIVIEATFDKIGTKRAKAYVHVQ